MGESYVRLNNDLAKLFGMQHRQSNFHFGVFGVRVPFATTVIPL